MDEELLTAFWDHAKRRARLDGTFPAYFGPTVLGSVPPPAWSFGAAEEEADRRVQQLVDGELSATATPLAAYETPDSLPKVGELGIVVDGSGRPRALVATTEVRIVPFTEVDRAHTDHADGVAAEEKVVLETLRVLFSSVD